MTEFGQALRLARERRELTQTQVMALTGINNKTLSGYENGVAEPDLQTLATLLQLYQGSADQLLGLNGGAPAGPVPPAARRSAPGADPAAEHPAGPPRGKKDLKKYLLFSPFCFMIV